jgi:hypothetical protein
LKERKARAEERIKRLQAAGIHPYFFYIDPRRLNPMRHIRVWLVRFKPDAGWEQWDGDGWRVSVSHRIIRLALRLLSPLAPNNGRITQAIDALATADRDLWRS